MNLRTILTSLLIAASIAAGSSQNKSGHSNSVEAHRQAHARLASVNTKLDMSSINEKIREEIEDREAMAEGRNSETMQMMADLRSRVRDPADPEQVRQYLTDLLAGRAYVPMDRR